MLLDMATKNMDPVSRTIMRSSIGAELLDMDMASGGAGGQGSFGNGMVNLQQQLFKQQQQRQQQLLLQQRQQKLLQLQYLKRQQLLKQQRDAANMILAAAAVGKAAGSQSNAISTGQAKTGYNPYTAPKKSKDSIHITLYISSPSATFQRAARTRLRQAPNPASTMAKNMMMMQAMRGMELV